MRRIIIIGSIVMVLALAGLVIGLTTRGNDDDQAPQKIEVVERSDFVVKINSSGNLESLLSVEIKSNVEGEVEKLYVQDGDFIEKGQVLLQIDDEQIKEEMKQAEANVAASTAQLEQARRSLVIKNKQLDNALKEQIDSVTKAQTSYDVTKVTTPQQISQQKTDIQNIREALGQDEISLQQAKISLTQAQLTLSELELSEEAAKIDLDNADSELKRTQELYTKKYVPKKSLEDAQASYANASSRYESAQKRFLSQKETVKFQEGSVKSRERAIQMRDATLKIEVENLELLRQTRAAQEIQDLTQLSIVERRLEELQENIGDEKDINRFSLESTKANLLRNESSLKNQKERLAWTTITAPMSGIVINLQIEEGEIVTSGRSAFSQSPPIMEIVDLLQMVVTTFINEVDMEKLAIKQKAEIKLRAYPDRVYTGEVREISPSGRSRDNIIYFEVVVAVLGSPEELRPGMTADVDIVVIEHRDALLLPIEAVKIERSMGGRGGAGSRGGRGSRGGAGGRGPGSRGGRGASGSSESRPTKQHYVMLAKKGADSTERAEGVKTPVEVGEQNDMFIEILSGLNENDEVIIEAAPQVMPGQFGRRR